MIGTLEFPAEMLDFLNLNNLNGFLCVSKSNEVEDKTASVKPTVMAGCPNDKSN